LGWRGAGAGVFFLVVVRIAGMSYYSRGTADVTGFSFHLALGLGAATGTVVGIQETRTTTREREAARERAAAAAAEAERENLLFLNNLLRHHVLNGLQVIRGNAAVLREEHDPDSARTVVERSDAVAAVVRNVRTLVDANTTDPSLDRVDLSAFLRREVDALGESYPETVVETDVPDGLSVVADSLLPTIFENLLHNAVEHNDEAVPRVIVEAEAAEDGVRVRVADNGPGIEDVPDAFEPGDSGSRGVGLHLVRTLVSRYDGDVTVDSSDDGTTVEVTLPAAPCDRPAQQAAIPG
jgi:signal transduction histidine kinase